MNTELEIWKILSTGFIGVAGIVLAIVQVQLKKKELKSTLLDKRIEIYDAFIYLSYQCGLQAPNPDRAIFHENFTKYQRYKFFFTGEIKENLKLLETQLIVSWHLWNSSNLGSLDEISINKEKILKLIAAVQDPLEKEIGVFTSDIYDN